MTPGVPGPKSPTKITPEDDQLMRDMSANPPPHPGKGQRRKTPLEYAIDTGFHSITQVLLEAGAIQEPEGLEAPIYRALNKRRYDIVRLLVEHGFDARRIDMDQVFHSWEPEMMSYFIERGADIITGQPLAVALCDRIRTALNVYKQLREKRPELQVQADIALRHHCYEGNTKWVSPLLWAGADPFTLGEASPNTKGREEDEECYSALNWATPHLAHPRIDPAKTTHLPPVNSLLLPYYVE